MSNNLDKMVKLIHSRGLSVSNSLYKTYLLCYNDLARNNFIGGHYYFENIDRVSRGCFSQNVLHEIRSFIFVPMILSHKIRLYPTKEQSDALQRACGVARFTYNWALAEWGRQYKEGGKPSGSELRRYFNSVKKEEFPWIYDSPKNANQQPFSDLQTAFTRFFQKKSKYPKFKKRGIHDSFYLSNDQFKINADTVAIPHIKEIRTAESLRFKGKIQSATISRTADLWFISISVDIPDYSKPRTSDNIIGVDLGIKSLAVCSDGTIVDSLSPLKKSLEKLQRFSRQHSRKQKGSNNRKKSATKLARLHYKISNKRSDVLHKFSTQLCRENQTIVIEDLAVKNLLKNHNLARAIADAGFGEFRRQLTYKSKIFGNNLVIVDRFFPSSKTCSNCGSVKEILSLSERTFSCPDCGTSIDRDLNAALNLRTLGLRGINACGEEGSGRRPLAASVKPRFAEAGNDRILSGRERLPLKLDKFVQVS